MYLIDTNIWLERLLEQERSDEVGGSLTLVSFDGDFDSTELGRKMPGEVA